MPCHFILDKFIEYDFSPKGEMSIMHKNKKKKEHTEINKYMQYLSISIYDSFLLSFQGSLKTLWYGVYSYFS